MLYIDEDILKTKEGTGLRGNKNARAGFPSFRDWKKGGHLKVGTEIENRYTGERVQMRKLQMVG